MRTRNAILTLFLFLVACPAAYANAIPPSFALLPGFQPIDITLALSATVLLAVLERPFVTRAGVARCALWYSLQANLVALLLGCGSFILLMLFGMGPGILVFILGMFVVSIWIECAYYRRQVVDDPAQFRSGWIIAGNLFSFAVLWALLILLDGISTDRRDLVVLAYEYHPVSACISVIGSLAAFALGMVMPAIARKRSENEAAEPDPAPSAAAISPDIPAAHPPPFE
jgi:hypothetical protein